MSLLTEIRALPAAMRDWYDDLPGRLDAWAFRARLADDRRYKRLILHADPERFHANGVCPSSCDRCTELRGSVSDEVYAAAMR